MKKKRREHHTTITNELLILTVICDNAVFLSFPEIYKVGIICFINIGRKCYHCDAVDRPEDCHTTAVCQSNQVLSFCWSIQGWQTGTVKNLNLKNIHGNTMKSYETKCKGKKKLININKQQNVDKNEKNTQQNKCSTTRKVSIEKAR